MRSLPLPLPPRGCPGRTCARPRSRPKLPARAGAGGRGASSQSKGLGAARRLGASAFQGSPLTTDIDRSSGSPVGRALLSAPGASSSSARRLRPPRSAAQAEAFDERPVAGDIVVLEVAEQPAAATDHLQQAAARVVVVLVDLEMLGELVDARGQQGHLDLGRAGVAFLGRVLGDDLGLVVLDQHAATSPMTMRILPGGPGWR